MLGKFLDSSLKPWGNFVEYYKKETEQSTMHFLHLIYINLEIENTDTPLYSSTRHSQNIFRIQVN
jgi:hypothetical protein